MEAGEVEVGWMSVLGELGSLVGWERGRVSPGIYFDEEVYRREQARVFAAGWVPVGHADMVRNPGDYVASYMGEVPVIVVRGRDGKVRVLVNKCRHRGNQVCLFDRGNVPGVHVLVSRVGVRDGRGADQRAGGGGVLSRGAGEGASGGCRRRGW